MGIGFLHKACEPWYSNKKKFPKLLDSMKEFDKERFNAKVWQNVIRETISRYDITEDEAAAQLLYAVRSALMNDIEKGVGGKRKYWFDMVNDELEKHWGYLDSDFVEAIDRMWEKVKGWKSWKNRLSMLLYETNAYWHYHNIPHYTGIRDLLDWADEKLAKPINKLLGSKILQLTIFGVLLHDVFNYAKAGDDHVVYAYDENLDKIKIIHSNKWYQRSSFVGTTERWGWAIWDGLIEEVGRDAVSSCLQEVGFEVGSRGLKLLAKAIFNIMSFAPQFEALGSVARAVEFVGDVLENSLLLRLVGQPFIEWQLEKWMAAREWNFLRNFRYKFAELFQYEKYRKFQEKVHKINAFRDYLKKYTKVIKPYQIDPKMRLKREIKDLGFKDIPPDMQKMYKEYQSIKHKRNAFDMIDEFMRHFNNTKGNCSHGHTYNVYEFTHAWRVTMYGGESHIYHIWHDQNGNHALGYNNGYWGEITFLKPNQHNEVVINVPDK